MKDLIKVRIDKCANNDNWYSNQIGSELFVTQNKKHNDVYDFVSMHGTTYIIRKSDCKVLTEVEKDEPEEWVPQVGEWVITEGYSKDYDGTPLQINKIEDDCCWFNDTKTVEYRSSHNFWIKDCRKAFPHEIPAPEPKGYCIKRTSENAEVLNKWMTKLVESAPFFDVGYVYSIPIDKSKNPYLHGIIKEGFTELFTTEDFFAKVNYTPEPEMSKFEKVSPQIEEQKQESERIPFDLEKWKTGKYDVVTRNDWSVYIIKTDLNCAWRKPLVGVLCYGEIGKAKEAVCTWSINGEEHVGDRPTDLFLIPKTETVWVNHFESPEYTSETMAINESAFCPNGYKLIETIEVKRPIK